jgi:DNA-binding response OmpR family regulator
VKILIADDQLDAARLLVTLLNLDGYQAELTENWEGLIDEIILRKPDLLILDVRLPGVDGLALLRQLRGHSVSGIANLPVLLASALDHSYEGELAGANGFLLKPYTRQELLDSIKESEKENTPT